MIDLVAQELVSRKSIKKLVTGLVDSGMPKKEAKALVGAIADIVEKKK